MNYYEAGKYLDQDTGRWRWAVCDRNGVKYFPKRYGKLAAELLAYRLNQINLTPNK